MKKESLKTFTIIFGIVLVLFWGMLIYFILWSTDVHHFTLLIIATFATFVWVIMAHSLLNKKIDYEKNKLTILYEKEEFKKRRKKMIEKLMSKNGVEIFNKKN